MFLIIKNLFDKLHHTQKFSKIINQLRNAIAAKTDNRVTFKNPKLPEIEEEKKEIPDSDAVVNQYIECKYSIALSEIAHVKGDCLSMDYKTIFEVTSKNKKKAFFKHRVFPIPRLNIDLNAARLNGDRMKAMIRYCCKDLYLNWERDTNILEFSHLVEYFTIAQPSGT